MTWLLRIEVANWKVVAAIAGLAAVTFVVAYRDRRRRAVLLAGGLVAALLFMVDGVNTYFGYLPQVADVLGVQDWPTISASALAPSSDATRRPAPGRGGILTLRVEGEHSGLGPRHVYVYLPPQYFTEPTARFPVVYLLHGSPGRAEDWLRAGRAVDAGNRLAATGEPLILVIPPMSHAWLDDSECVDGRDGHWDTWLSQDVVSAIDARLRTRPDRAGRGLAGMSAGGYCALNLLVRHSAEFSAAIDLSGYTGPTHEGGMKALFGPRWATPAAANTPAAFLRAHPVMTPLALWFDTGGADPTPSAQLRSLEPVLASRRVLVVSSRGRGGHTYHVWVPGLREGLGWISEWFSTEQRAAATG